MQLILWVSRRAWALPFWLEWFLLLVVDGAVKAPGWRSLFSNVSEVSFRSRSSALATVHGTTKLFPARANTEASQEVFVVLMVWLGGLVLAVVICLLDVVYRLNGEN